MLPLCLYNPCTKTCLASPGTFSTLCILVWVIHTTNESRLLFAEKQICGDSARWSDFPQHRWTSLQCIGGGRSLAGAVPVLQGASNWLLPGGLTGVNFMGPFMEFALSQFSSPTAVIGAVCFLLTLYLVSLGSTSRENGKEPPGPSRLPLLGNLLLFDLRKPYKTLCEVS